MSAPTGIGAQESSGGVCAELTFQDFFKAEYARLVRAVALVAGNTSTAEDAVQEALARAWQRTNEGEQLESLGAWTVSVALNLTRSAARRDATHRRLRHMLLLHRGEEPSPDREAALDLQRGLAVLPRRQREVTVLHYYLGWPVGEIASVLDVSEGTVKTALHRARFALADHVRDATTDDEEVTSAADARRTTSE